MKDLQFSVKDLINNGSFQRVVDGTASTDEIRFWDTWVEDSEANRKKAIQARKEFIGELFQDPIYPNIEEKWESLKNRTIKKPKNFTKPRVRSRHHVNNRWKYYAAAIIILGAFIGISTHIYAPKENTFTHLEQIENEKVISAKAGEQKTITFSNGSRIILNSNSTVKYSIRNSDKGIINVIVDGEAYFDTGNDGDNNKESIFEVNTPDGIIRDIGTKFLVRVKSDRSLLILEEGKILIRSKIQKDTNSDELITSGYLAEIKDNQVISKKLVNTTFHTSWATGVLEFDQTSIGDFAEFIEQRFDVTVKISDPKISEVKIEGGIYFQSVEELVRAVSDVTDIPVYKSADRDTIYIGKINGNKS